MRLRGIITALVVGGLATHAAAQMMPATLEMYEALPRPEQVERATTVKELRRYLTSDSVDLLQWMVMLRIAEIGGDEATDALYHIGRPLLKPPYGLF